MNDKETGIIGPKLRLQREHLHLTQAQIAEKLGITARTQRNYEMGTRVPDADYLVAASKIGVDLSEVLGIFDSISADARAATNIKNKNSGEIKREIIQRAVEVASVQKDPYAAIAYALSSESLSVEGWPAEAAIKSHEQAEIDLELLANIFEGMDSVSNRLELVLTPIKRAQAVAMLYRAFKRSMTIDPIMIEETVKLASS